MSEQITTEDAAPFPCVRCGSGDRCQQVEFTIDGAVKPTTTLCRACLQDLAQLLSGQKTQLLDFLAERPKGQSE